MVGHLVNFGRNQQNLYWTRLNELYMLIPLIWKDATTSHHANKFTTKQVSIKLYYRCCALCKALFHEDLYRLFGLILTCQCIGNYIQKMPYIIQVGGVTMYQKTIS